MVRWLKKCERDEGLTLVEVMLTLSIFSIIVLLMFSFLESGLRSYYMGVEKIDEQAQLRYTTYRITQEVRNVFEVDIYNQRSSVPGGEYIYLEDGILTQYTNGTTINLSAPIVVDVNFYLNSLNDKYVLKVELISANDALTTDILLNNIQNEDVLSNIKTGATDTKVLEILTIPN